MNEMCPESLVTPIFTAWVTGTLEEGDLSREVLFCMHLFPFIEGRLLSDPKMEPFIEQVCICSGY
jgi:hypothetical protein